MANTNIGEVSIYYDDKEYLLRPSFKNIASIEDYNTVAGQVGLAVQSFMSVGAIHWTHVLPCWTVIQACADEFVPAELIGEINEDLTITTGALELYEVAAIANGLMKWGLYGEPSDERKGYARAMARTQKPDGSPVNIEQYFGIAVAPSGLGMSTTEAWNLTMREFQIAYDIQFPLTDKQKSMIPPPPEVEAKMMEQIRRARERMKYMPKSPAKRLR